MTAARARARPGDGRVRGLLLLLCARRSAALVVRAAGVDGRSFGGFLAHHVVCAATRPLPRGERGCSSAPTARDDAAMVRGARAEPRLRAGRAPAPVDWRGCRRPGCASAPDDPRARRATAATRRRARHGVHPPDPARRPALHPVLALLPGLEHRPGRVGPGLGAVLAPAAHPRARARHARLSRLPRDDWEGVFVRLDPDGSDLGARQLARPLPGLQVARLPGPLAPHAPAGCASRAAATRATCRSGSSRGRRSGPQPRIPRYIPPPGSPVAAAAARPLFPGRDLNERTTSGEGLRLVPLETRDRAATGPATTT